MDTSGAQLKLAVDSETSFDEFIFESLKSSDPAQPLLYSGDNPASPVKKPVRGQACST